MTGNKSYRQILKSTGIFGGSQVVNIFIGFVRTKIIAVLLGVGGIGVIGIYQSIIDMIKSFAMLGLDTSGIKDVASANSGGNRKIISESVAILKKWMLSLSIFGAIICAVFSYPIALWAFGEEGADSQIYAVAALSICILFMMLGVGQTAVMQGLRKIPEMVKSNILGNFLGLLVSIPLYFFFGVWGIVPSLILGGVILFLTTLFFSRKIDVDEVQVSFKYAYSRGRNMLRMGIFIVSASVCQTASMFILRSFISQRMGVDGVGIFMASWTITNVYLALILRSMGADFYPRLCGVASSNIRIRRLVNEQTHIILIVASPIIVGMLLATDWVISLQYTSEFLDASSLLRWQVVASFLKVISWPMGFILLAKGKGKLFFFTELLFFLFYLGISYLLFPIYGLNGTGIGYLVAYIVYLVALILITIRICNFKWRMSIFRLGMIYFSLIVFTFWMTNFQHDLLVAAILFLVTTVFSIKKFNTIFSIKGILSRFLKK